MPCIIIEPIKTDIAKLPDFIGSPIQNQEQIITHIKVINLIDKDFLENICMISLGLKKTHEI